VFPSDTRFYWFKPSDGIEKLDRTIPYLNKTKKAMVITPTRFSSDIGVARVEENSKIAYDLLVKNEKRYTDIIIIDIFALYSNLYNKLE